MRGWAFLRGQGDKLAVRPLLVDDFYLHFLRSARPGYVTQPATIPVSQVLPAPCSLELLKGLQLEDGGLA